MTSAHNSAEGKGGLVPNRQLDFSRGSSCLLQHVTRLANLPKMALNICLHPRGSHRRWEPHRNNSERSHLDDILKWWPKYLPVLAKWVSLPHHLHRLCSGGEKPSAHVVPGYPGYTWLLPRQHAAYQLGSFHRVSKENWQRPRRLKFPRAAPPADSLGKNWGDMGQCPSKGTYSACQV